MTTRLINSVVLACVAALMACAGSEAPSPPGTGSGALGASETVLGETVPPSRTAVHATAAKPTPTARPTERTPTEHSTLASFAAACGRLVAKERETRIDPRGDAIEGWWGELAAEIPPSELRDFWEVRREYLGGLPRAVPDYTPPG